MSNEKELKEDVIPYLNERIEGQKRLLRIAKDRDDKRMTLHSQDIYKYGVDLLAGVKRDISK